MEENKKKLKRKYFAWIFAVFAIALLSFGFVSAFGFSNGLMVGLSDQDKETLETQREAMQTAIENGDYETWETLMLEKIEMMKNEVNQENFQRLVEMNQNKEEFKSAMEEARETGDYESMQEVREQYGFPEMHGKGFAFGRGMHIEENEED
ncbi:MAG: hypothetical protein WC812_02055 [Candidatus Pacearchaeota archaeon]